MAQKVGFTATELLRLVPGLPYRTLDGWTRSGLIEASAQPSTGRGSTRRYTLADVMAARVIRELRTAPVGQRISLQALRKVVERLRQNRRRAIHPLATTSLILIPGSRPDLARVVVTDDAATEVESLLRAPGQHLLAPIVVRLEPLAAEVRGQLVSLENERLAKAEAAAERRRVRERRKYHQRRARERAAAEGDAAA